MMNSTATLRNNDSNAALYKSQAQVDDSIKTAELHCHNVEIAIELCQKKLREYGEIVQNIQNQIADAHAAVKQSEVLAKKDIEPLVANILSLLKKRKTTQLEVNEKLQKQIIELKKEKAELVQNIIRCKKKVDELQKDLGKYPGDRNMKTSLGPSQLLTQSKYKS